MRPHRPAADASQPRREMSAPKPPSEREVRVVVPEGVLGAMLVVPANAKGLVIFAHGSGSSRFSPRNHFVAQQLNGAGFSTLLMDLLTQAEEGRDELAAGFRFDIAFLARRLQSATQWAKKRLAGQTIGYFGASTGAAAALVAAAEAGDAIAAVVSRGGRPDLAGEALPHVKAPTLLIVGGDDRPVIEMNRQAQTRLHCPSELVIVPGAGHLFEEPGSLERVAGLATAWFERHLVKTGDAAPGRSSPPVSDETG
jgi:putative phosphoribosyl transferase